MALRAALFCDASPEHGSGHVMRQITLGHALRARGCIAELHCHEIPDPLIERADYFGIPVVRRDQPQRGPEIRSGGFPNELDIAVIDGYGFSAEAIAELDANVVVVIDDNGDHANACSDLIVNQNLHANAALYSRNRSAPELLLGTEWALVRPEVVRARALATSTSRKGVFVSVGGLDHRGLVAEIYQGLSTIGIPVTAAGGFGSSGSLTPSEMAWAMRQARIGVIACGTTTWEAACLGLPMIGLVIADNQELVAQSIEKAGLGETFDCRARLDVKSIELAVANLHNDTIECEKRSAIGVALVDGFGADRVSAKILEYAMRSTSVSISRRNQRNY